MRIAFANDHAAVAMRQSLVDYIRNLEHEVLDFGVETDDAVDYPDLAGEAVRAVLRGEADLAVLACGTGIGMSIAANKFPGIRCALCTDVYAARMARHHNNANALALRGREIDVEENYRILDTFFNTDFVAGRHQRRLDKLQAIEEQGKEA